MLKAELVFMVVLGAALALALLGPPPATSRPRLALRVGLAAAGAYALAAVMALAAGAVAAAVLACPGVVGFSLSCWLSRGADEDDGRWDDDDEPDPPVDWDDFDRARERWERVPVA
jgi:hypothetical protein